MKVVSANTNPVDHIRSCDPAWSVVDRILEGSVVAGRRTEGINGAPVLKDLRMLLCTLSGTCRPTNLHHVDAPTKQDHKSRAKERMK
jgi:hypothetical protein